MQRFRFTLKAEVSIVIACLGVAFMLMFLSSLNDAPTYDEPLYVTSGVHYWETGTYILNPEHPPLVKDIAAMPLLFQPVSMPKPEPGDTYAQNGFSRRVFNKYGNDLNLMLQRARLPMMLLTLLTILLVYLWARKLMKVEYALLVLVLISFNPLLLGYGKLVILDQAAALGILFAVYCYWKYTRKPGAANFWLTVLAFGLAQLVKFTSLTLIPVFIILALWEVKNAVDRKKELRHQSLALLGIFSLGFLLVLAVYGMHTAHMSRQTMDAVIEKNLLDGDVRIEYLKSVSRISPPLAQYLLGLAKTTNHFQLEFPVYLGGKIYPGGVWYEGFYSFLVKTPLTYLFLLVFFLPGLIRRRREQSIRFQTVPIVIVFAFTLLLTRQFFGVRYILPIYPFLAILIGLGLQASLERPGKRARVKWVATLLATAFLVCSALLTFPNYISFFNEIIEPREQAYRYLVDSDLDWGQDLRRLADYVEEKSIEDITVDYLGAGEVNYYIPRAKLRDCHSKERPSGYFAVFATTRQYTLRFDDDNYKWLDEYEPVKIIGNSIFIYDFTGTTN